MDSQYVFHLIILLFFAWLGWVVFAGWLGDWRPACHVVAVIKNQ